MSKYRPAGMESEEEDDDQLNAHCWRGIRKTAQNQKITVVPDVTAAAGLDGRPFDATLSGEEQSLLESLRQMWTAYKQGPILSQRLKQLYACHADPYNLALRLYANCRDTTSTKATSLAFSILDELRSLQVPDIVTNTTLHIDDNHRMVAFNLVRKNSAFYAAVTEAFALHRRADLFVDKLHHLATVEHCYKEACMWAEELQLYAEFDHFVFVLPLIMQDKSSVTEKYMRRAGEPMQRELIVFLDTLLDRRSANGAVQSVQNRCAEIIAMHGYTEVNMVKLQTKPLNKLITRLAKMFRVGADAMPNVFRAKTYGALQFLMHKNFTEHSLNLDSWREMVKETVPRQPDALELHADLISTCCLYGAHADAHYWAEFYAVPRDRWPHQLVDHVKKQKHKKPSPSRSAPNDGPSHHLPHHSPSHHQHQLEPHTLRLPPQHITLVATEPQFHQMLDDLIAQRLVAFDAEWKPSFCADNELDLIQLATRTHVYLLDVPQLLLYHHHLWPRLANELFHNADIVKLAFSPSSDLMLFGKSLPGFAGIAQTIAGMLDLQAMWQLLNSLPAHAFRFPCAEKAAKAAAAASNGATVSGGGAPLSGLVALCLGKLLDKSNQFSNWQQRPLRPEQVQYAALDAFCLIECYDVMSSEYERTSGREFFELMGRLMVSDRRQLVVAGGARGRGGGGGGGSRRRVRGGLRQGQREQQLQPAENNYQSQYATEAGGEAHWRQSIATYQEQDRRQQQQQSHSNTMSVRQQDRHRRCCERCGGDDYEWFGDDEYAALRLSEERSYGGRPQQQRRGGGGRGRGRGNICRPVEWPARQQQHQLPTSGFHVCYNCGRVEWENGI